MDEQDTKQIARETYDAMKLLMDTRIAETGLTRKEWMEMVLMSTLLTCDKMRQILLEHAEAINLLIDSGNSQLQGLVALAGQMKDMHEALGALSKGYA